MLTVQGSNSILSLVASRKEADVNLTNHILSFLTPEDLASLTCVGRVWRQAIGEKNWATQAKIQGMIPEIVPVGMTQSQVFKDLYPGSFGPQFFQEYLGKIEDVPPIPRSFIAAANAPDPFEEGKLFKDCFQLLLVPAFITIAVNNSKLTLNKNGRLIEGPEAIREKREIRVPVTLNNIAKLVETCLKKGNPTGISSEDSWQNVFQQHGDEPVRQSYWSYQKSLCIAPGYSYRGQQAIVARARLEIVPLIDRVLLTLFMYVRSRNRHEKLCATRFSVRTSTLTLEDNAPFRQWLSCITPSHRLSMRLGGFFAVSFSIEGIGAGVGVPPGSFQRSDFLDDSEFTEYLLLR